MAVALTVPAHYQRNTPPSGTNQTWCCWFKVNNQPEGDLVFNAIIAQDADANSWINVEVDADAGSTSRITVWANPTAGGDAPRITGPLVDYDEWYFVALVKAGNNYTLYWRHEDDDTLSSTSATWTSTIGTTKIRFGAEHQIDVDTALDGALAHCRIFTSALSASDVLAESNSPTAVAAAWADWPIASTTNHTTDASGNNRTLIATASTGGFANTTGPTFDVEPSEGTGDAPIALTLAAAGTADRAGTADAPIELDLTATGATTRQGAAAIPLGLALAAEGRVVRRNSAEGGSDETAVTTGNSGGASLDPWTQVALGEGSAIVYDSAEAAHGDLSYSIRQAANQVAFLIRSVAASDQALLSFYLRFPSLFSVTSAICQLHNGSGPAASLNLTSTGRVQVNNSAGTTIFTTDLNSPLEPDTWYRVELRARRGTGTDDGTIEFAYYLGDDTTPVESFSSTSVNAGTLPITNARLGRTFGATADTTPVWVDSIQVATGPAAAALGLPWPHSDVDPNEGAADTPIAVGLAAAGVADRAGAGDAPLEVALAATGGRTPVAASDVPFVVEVAATGATDRLGAAAAPIGVSVAAAGSTARTGAADAPIALALAAAGTTGRSGTADAPISIAIDAVGEAPPEGTTGTANVPVGLQAAAAGHRDSLAAGIVPFAVAVEAAGERSPVGAGAASFALAPSAAGRRIPVALAGATIALDLTAEGSAPSVGPAEGTGTVPISIGLEAHGVAPRYGTAALTLALALTGEGPAPVPPGLVRFVTRHRPLAEMEVTTP